MRSRRAFHAATFALGALLAFAGTARAQVALPLTQVSHGDIRVDGMLREWHGVRFAQVGEGDDGSMRYALAYDDGGLYVAASVADQRIIRTRHPGPKEDAVIFTFAAPSGHHLQAEDVWLWAGVPGRFAASAGIGRLGGHPHPLSGVQIVEGPRRGGAGYVLEAYIPWRRLPGGSHWQEAHGAIRLRDVDEEAHPMIAAEPSSAPIDPHALDRLPELRPSGGEHALLTPFLRQEGLEAAVPRFNLHGNVSGDRRPEHVMVIGNFAVVLGPGYRGGQGYDFLQLPTTSPSDVRSAELVDLTGDGRDELTLRLREHDERGSRDLWQVVAFDGTHVQPIFAIEVRKQTSAGWVEAELSVRRGRHHPAQIEVHIGHAHGLPDHFRESSATDAESILVPWGPVEERVYRWDGHRFAKVSEQVNPHAVNAVWDGHRFAPVHGAAAAAGSTQAENAAEPERAAPAPLPPSMQDLVAQVRHARHVARGVRPRFEAHANVAEDRRDETLMVLGKALLIVGPGYRGGSGYFWYEVPVASPDDLLAMRAVDVTGDGVAEVLLKVRQHIGDITRQVLLVYQLAGTSFQRVLAVEVGRSDGDNRITDSIHFAGRGSRAALEIRPGSARGWGAGNWPFTGGTNDGVAPLLVPWRDHAVRYRFVRGQLVPRSSSR